MKWAFSDESRRGGTYVVAAVVVETHEVNAVRASLRQFLRSNQRRVHMAKESPARRRQFLAMVEQAVSVAHIVEVAIGADTMAKARDRGLAALVRVLVDEGVAMWHLEWMVDGVQRRDRQVIASELLEDDPPADLRYDHTPPHDEPMLWAADALAWAASRRPVLWANTHRA